MSNLGKQVAISLQDLSKIDAMLKAAGMPSYTDLACALCDVLDGEQDHDIAEIGLTASDTDKVCKGRAGAVPL